MSRISDILTNGTVNAMKAVFGANSVDYGLMVGQQTQAQREEPAELYDLLRSLYYNDHATRQEGQNGLILGLRNPTRAVVDFYAATMWPGTLPDALPIEMDDDNPYPDAVREAIQRVWEWSNWESRKQVYARNAAMLGDSLIKISTRQNTAGETDAVYLQLIEPDYLTDFDVDERDYLTFIRLDIPRQRRTDGKTEQYLHTEVWDKAAGTYRVWEHQHPGRAIEQLGTPTVEADILSEFGFDFLPFVHSKFIDLGNPRGVAAMTPALVKAHEASRMASRLHQVAFQYQKPDMVLYSDLTDEDNQPLPPPIINDNGGPLELAEAMFHRLPSGWKLQHLIANLPFVAHLEILNAHLEHLQQTDLPELAYYRVADSREMSGKAIRFMLTAAIARAQEARANAEAALARANQMALTIGGLAGLPGFTDFADDAYEQGHFNHWFSERQIIPLADDERADVEKVRAETAALHMAVGYPEDRILEDLGMTESEIAEYRASQPGSAATPAESDAPGEFDRGFTGGPALDMGDMSTNRG